MANVITGSFTLKEVLQITKQSQFENRFDYKERDVLRSIKVQERVQLKPDRPNEPTVKYIIRTYSYPQYKPYLQKGQTRQHTYKHQYDSTLEMDRLSLNTTSWKYRLGSGKVWKEAPQNLIRSIYKRNLKVWPKSRIEQHRKNTKPYLDSGDWNSRVQGINADWIFRCWYAYFLHGHGYGRNYYGNVPSSLNPKNIVFAPKHFIALLEVLMNKGILKDN